VDAFCYEESLLALNHPAVEPDELEVEYFQRIDDAGKAAFAALTKNDRTKISHSERCDVARFLMSLQARLPENVKKLRDGADYHAKGLNTDIRIQSEMLKLGISETPSELFERLQNTTLSDRSMSIILRLTDNTKVGNSLINSLWEIVEVAPIDGQFVLSDRPLYRSESFDHPSCIWALPLRPNLIFLCTPDPAVMAQFRKMPKRKLVKMANYSALENTRKYVFTAQIGNFDWISKRLRPS
jgi:hypothetical protein